MSEHCDECLARAIAAKISAPAGPYPSREALAAAPLKIAREIIAMVRAPSGGEAGR